MALKLRRVDAVEADVADLKTRMAAVEAVLAALPPSLDYAPQIAAVQAEVDAIKTALDAVPA